MFGRRYFGFGVAGIILWVKRLLISSLWLNYTVFWRRIEYFVGVGNSASFLLSNSPLLFHLATLLSDVKAGLELLLAVVILKSERNRHIQELHPVISTPEPTPQPTSRSCSIQDSRSLYFGVEEPDTLPTVSDFRRVLDIPCGLFPVR